MTTASATVGPAFARPLHHLCAAGRTCAVVAAAGIASLLASTQFTSDTAKDLSRHLASSGFGTLLSVDIASLQSSPVERINLLRREARRPVRFVEARTVAGLVAVFNEAEFTLPAVSRGKPVPRIFVKSVPVDIKRIKTTAARKSVFLRTVLPLVLQVNEALLRQRKRLKVIAAAEKRGRVNASDQQWVAQLSEKYGLKTPSAAALLHHVDAVPPSLALAQAIVESGWGRSAAARRGNSLFGQMAYGRGTKGIVVMQGNVRARIAGFDNLLTATQAYVFNLNSHPAYRQFRRQRANLRTAGKPLSGHYLAGTLLRYSELGMRYVRYIRGAIRTERLARFDVARLTR